MDAGVVRRAQQRELLAPGSTVLPSERSLASDDPEIPAGLLAAAGRHATIAQVSRAAPPPNFSADSTRTGSPSSRDSQPSRRCAASRFNVPLHSR